MTNDILLSPQEERNLKELQRLWGSKNLIKMHAFEDPSLVNFLKYDQEEFIELLTPTIKIFPVGEVDDAIKPLIANDTTTQKIEQKGECKMTPVTLTSRLAYLIGLAKEKLGSNASMPNMLARCIIEAEETTALAMDRYEMGLVMDALEAGEWETSSFAPGSFVIRTRSYSKDGKNYEEGAVILVDRLSQRGDVVDQRGDIHLANEIRKVNDSDMSWFDAGRSVKEFKEGDTLVLTFNETQVVGSRITIEEARTMWDSGQIKRLFPADAAIDNPFARGNLSNE